MTAMKRFVFLAAALSLAASAVMAQDAPSQQGAPQKPTGPTVVKQFSGWSVRCFPVNSIAPCDVWEATVIRKTGQFALSVSVAYVPSQDAQFIQFKVPLGVDFASGAKFISDGYTSELLRYDNCDRDGCSLVVPQGSAIVTAMKSQSKATVRVVMYRGKPLVIPIPLKGFGDALTEMMELARQKAATPSPAPAPNDAGGTP